MEEKRYDHRRSDRREYPREDHYEEDRGRKRRRESYEKDGRSRLDRPLQNKRMEERGHDRSHSHDSNHGRPNNYSNNRGHYGSYGRENKRRKGENGAVYKYEDVKADVPDEKNLGVPPLADPKSEKQIATLWDNRTLRDQFLMIVNKNQFYKKYEGSMEFRRKVEDLCRHQKKDSEIYDELKNWYHNEFQKQKEQWFPQRSQRRVQQVMELIERSRPRKVHALLDVGCSEGSITSSLGEAFILSAENTHGCDVVNLPKDKTVDFTFRHLEDPTKLPYEDQSFEVVSAFMSLHHMIDPFAMLKEIDRVLKPGGLFIVREHNCRTQGFALVLDLVHGCYAMVWSDPREMEDFKEYFARYRTRRCWTEIIESAAGFKETEESKANQSHPSYNNPLSWYYAVYQKPENVNVQEEEKNE